MAAIDNYLLDLEAQLVPLNESSQQFENRISKFSIPAYFIAICPWILCGFCFTILSILKDSAVLIVIFLFYFGIYTISQTSSIKLFLAKLFIQDFSHFNEIKIKIEGLEQIINITRRAKSLLTRLNIDELPIKREIDRTNLLGFKNSLENLEFKNYTYYSFIYNISDPCEKILNRIANYSTTDAKQTEKTNTSTKTATPSPAKQVLRTTPNIIAKPKAPKIHFIVTSLVGLFSIEKPEIRERNLLHSRDLSIPPPERKDYFKINETNAEMGLQGEFFVIEYERNRLTNLKRKDLADKIAHISKNEGDHFGYDIISFDEFGNEKYIEVKTTSFGFNTTFYLTNNELFTLNQNGSYFIYRVYNFDLEKKSGSIYIIDLLNGDLLKYFTMEPILFKIWPHKIQ